MNWDEFEQRGIARREYRNADRLLRHVIDYGLLLTGVTLAALITAMFFVR
jgi:hypothetical protein